MKIAAAILNVVLVVAYPLVIWWSLSRYSARSVALIGLAFIAAVIALRFRNAEREHVMAAIRVPLIIMTTLALSAVLDNALLLLLTPAIINGALLLLFGSTLRSGAMPMIERFARLQEDSLSTAQQAHCRQFTWLWCLFFVINGGVVLALALLGMRDLWALFSGGLGYAGMGIMFAIEFITRRIRFREYGRNPLDWALSKAFPPRPDAALAEEPS